MFLDKCGECELCSSNGGCIPRNPLPPKVGLSTYFQTTAEVVKAGFNGQIKAVAVAVCTRIIFWFFSYNKIFAVTRNDMHSTRDTGTFYFHVHIDLATGRVSLRDGDWCWRLSRLQTRLWKDRSGLVCGQLVQTLSALHPGTEAMLHDALSPVQMRG